MAEKISEEKAKAAGGSGGVSRPLAELLKEEIETQGGNSTTMNYCWWCNRDVNGMDIDPEPHKADCWLVRARAALGSLVSDPHAWQPSLDSREFYELMQTYRHAPPTRPAQVCEAFEAVKAWVRLNVPAPPVLAPTPPDKEKEFRTRVDNGINRHGQDLSQPPTGDVTDDRG